MLNNVKNISRQVCTFLLAAMLYPAPYLYGQSQYPLIEYNTEKGLSLNSVNDLLFDKQGFLWIATDGLQRFDGYRFQTFKNDPNDKKTIPGNFIAYLYEDGEGNLWVSHRTGLTVKPKGRFEFIDLSALIPQHISMYNKCVGETDSSIWVLNDSTGVYDVNKTSFAVKKLYSLPPKLSHTGFYMFSQLRSKNERVWLRKRLDKTGDLYLVTATGLRQFSNHNRIVVHFIIPAGKDSLVMVTDKLLYKASATDPFTPSRILQTSFNAAELDNEYITWPRKTGNNQYLLIGTKVILMYDGDKELISPFPYSEYFAGDLMRYLMETTPDRNKNSWLGFNGRGGIKVFSPKKFGAFKMPDKNVLPYCLGADGDGRVYAGIYLGDIEVYDKEGHFVQKIKLPEAHKKFGSPRSMAMIDTSTLIVRSVLNELYAIDTRKGSVQRISHLLPKQPDSLLGDFESAMQKIKDGEVWFSYRDNILSLQKDKNGFSCSKILSVPVKERITGFFYNAAGQLWIGTINNAWYFEKNKLEKINLPVSYIKHVNQHPDGSVWMTSTDGIFILKGSRVIKQLGTKDGLPNSFVYGVLFDEAGNSWISSNRGITKIDTAWRITSYTAKEGLQGDEFNTKGYCKGPDGTLYFAGVNGINFFKPENLVSKAKPSQTLLTGIEVNNLPYLPNLQPEFINTISLSHNQNNIRLSFSNMDFTVPERNQYKFWLKSFQADWSLPQTNNTVQYILPPGEYELHVLGSNYEGIWSKEPLILHIHIFPPWYQTTWAKTIFALLALFAVGGVFYFIYRNRYQKKLRILQMEQEVQKEKQRLSRDLHDNLGAQITWLSNNISQVETAQQQEQPVEQKMDRLKEGAGELMQTLRETIWILNKDKVSAIDFFDKLVMHASKYIEGYPSIQLQTEEQISTGIQLNSGQALQLFRICQEAVTNACKHSGASQLMVSASSDEKHFTIRISDNGKGFDLNTENPGHYGLQNMKQRAEESNLQFSIESVHGQGTSILITTPV